MSIRLARNADFSASRRMIMPVEGVLLWSCFGGSLEDTRRNYATADAAPLTVVGAPPVGANYADFTGLSAYLQTAIALPESFTLLAVARPLTVPPSSSAAPHLISALSAASGAYSGASLSLDTTTNNNIRTAASGTVGSTPNSRRSALAAVPDRNVPRCYAGVVQRSDMIRSYDMTLGVVGETTDTRTDVAPATLDLRIGSSGNGTAAYGPVRMYSAVILDHAADAEELDLIYGQLRRYHGADGLVV